VTAAAPILDQGLAAPVVLPCRRSGRQITATPSVVPLAIGWYAGSVSSGAPQTRWLAARFNYPAVIVQTQAQLTEQPQEHLIE
jgi:hypothetical protein